MNKRVRSALNSCISVVLALLLSFVVIGVLLLWQGYDPPRPSWRCLRAPLWEN